MQHTLEFGNDELSKKRFEYIFKGLIITGNNNGQKGLTILNREISLLDKVEAISEPMPCGKMLQGFQEHDRQLLFDNEQQIRTLILDDLEIELLIDYVGRVPWSIGASSRDAIKLLAWLKS